MFWDVILYILWFFLLFAWIYLEVILLSDLFSDHKVKGWVKALWTVLLVLFPFLGAIVYLIARGSGMSHRRQERTQEADSEFKQYIRQAAAGTPKHSAADEIAKLGQLRAEGLLTEVEFQAQKAKVLAAEH